MFLPTYISDIAFGGLGLTHTELTCERCGGTVVLGEQDRPMPVLGLAGECDCGAAYRLIGGTMLAVAPAVAH